MQKTDVRKGHCGPRRETHPLSFRPCSLVEHMAQGEQIEGEHSSPRNASPEHNTNAFTFRLSRALPGDHSCGLSPIFVRVRCSRGVGPHAGPAPPLRILYH